MSEEEKKLSRKDKKEKKKAEKLKKKREVRLFPANKKGKHKMRVMDLLRIMFYPIHSIVYPFKLYGNKKVGKGAYVYVGNHYCLWDIFYPAHTDRKSTV